MATIIDNRLEKKEKINTGDFVKLVWTEIGTQYYIAGSLAGGGVTLINLRTGSRYGSGFKNTQELLEDIKEYEGVRDFEIIPSEATTVTLGLTN